MRSQAVVGPVGLRLSGELVGDLAVLAEHPYGLSTTANSSSARATSARNPATVCRAPCKLNSRGSNP